MSSELAYVLNLMADFENCVFVQKRVPSNVGMVCEMSQRKM